MWPHPPDFGAVICGPVVLVLAGAGVAAACWLSSELSAGCGCEQGQVGFSGVSLLGCCRPQPQLGPGSVSYPDLGSGQPPGASGPASVPRQGCACPALGTLGSLHRRRQLGVGSPEPRAPSSSSKDHLTSTSAGKYPNCGPRQAQGGLALPRGPSAFI